MDDSERTMTHQHLRSALRQPGCALCRLRDSAGQRFVQDLLYEGVTDPERRAAVRGALGFCRDHSRTMLGASASLGVAIITQDLLTTLLDAIGAEQHRRRRRRDSLVAALSPEAPCPACAWADEMLSHYVGELVSSIRASGDLLDLYRASDGLCLPHFRIVLDGAPDKKVSEILINAQREIWQHLVHDLSEFIRKCDHRFRHEEWGEERDSWERAVSSLAGIPLSR
jgi:hypothetical protein